MERRVRRARRPRLITWRPDVFLVLTARGCENGLVAWPGSGPSRVVGTHRMEVVDQGAGHRRVEVAGPVQVTPAVLVSPGDGEGPIDWCPSRGSFAVPNEDLERDRLESRCWRDCHWKGGSADVEAVVRTGDPHDGGRDCTGQEESAVHSEGAVRARRYRFDEQELDGVLICTEWGWCRARQPRHDRASTGGDAEHEGNEDQGVPSPLGRHRPQRRCSTGADVQHLWRPLRCVIAGSAHLSTLRAGATPQRASERRPPAKAQAAEAVNPLPLT